MDLEVLKKKVSTFRGEGGRVRNVSDELLLEILSAWEQWTGPTKGFCIAVGVSQKGISSIIGKAKKLKREGQFPTSDFKEIKLIDSTFVPSTTIACGIEVNWDNGKVIRFSQVDQLVEFLQKVA